MASKGKSKTPKIDPAVQAAVEDLQRENVKTYPLSVLDEINDARQSDQRLGSALDDFFEAESKNEEVDARAAAKLAATDDGPVHELTAKDPERWDPMFRGGMVEVQTVWLDRAVQMAKADGFTVPEFIERLIKRQWIASGAGKGKR